MKVALNWLKKFLDLSQPPEVIADALTLAGLEVEGIERKEDGDVVFEVGLTPNLGHCMSMIGMVRELSAILNLPIRRREIVLEESDEKIENLVRVEIQDFSQCTKYCARLVRGVKVGPSPAWLAESLEKSGIRSVNNVVDVGNYVMLEMGQPLHLFDYDQLNEGHLVVCKAENDGMMETLDGHERPIPDGALLICSGSHPVAFAGVMGEMSSSVSEQTTNILIEGAHFTPEAVRKTSKQLNLRTDSSQRFERGIDPLAIETALDLAATLLEGEIVNGIIESVSKPYEARIIEMNPGRANQLLGIDLSASEMSAYLKRLEIEIVYESDKIIRTQIPSYRNDLRAEIDLIEEVGRLYGFNHIPRKLPRHTSSTMSHAPLFLFEEDVRTKLVAQGLQECLTCDLLSPSQVLVTSEKDPIRVLHPASIDQSVLRPSLLPGLLEMVRYNLGRQNLNIAAFEVGHLHLKSEGGFVQKSAAAIILSGFKAPYHYEQKPPAVDFFEIKGRVEGFLEAVGLRAAQWTPSHVHSFHPGRQAHVSIDSMVVGIVGEVHPRHLKHLGIDQRVYFAELDLHFLIDLKRSHPRVASFSLTPFSERDWTLSLDEGTSVGELLKEMRRFRSPLLEEVFLLDLYKSEKIGKDRKNATFRFRYRDSSKTVEAEEVEMEHKRLTQHIAEKLGNRVP